MCCRSVGLDENVKNSFLWLAPFAPPKGFTSVPQGGMCLCAYLFVVRGGKVLLGKYAEHPAWERLAGMDSQRVKANSHDWTIPSSHLKFGEDPRETARRIGEEILTLDKDLVYPEPYIKTFFYEPAMAPQEKHFDVLFLFEVSIEVVAKVGIPPWYEALEWLDVGAVRCEQFARQHEDVMDAWLRARARTIARL